MPWNLFLVCAITFSFTIHPHARAEGDLEKAPNTLEKSAADEPAPTPSPITASTDQSPAPAPAPATAPENATLTENDPGLPWYKRLTVRAAYGMTFVNKPYSKAMNMQGAFGYRSRSWLESGFAYRKEQAAYDESINFAATGYQETRTYQLETLVLAPYMGFRFFPSFSLLLSVGLSSTTSTLASVTTDAPAPSPLAPGYTKEAAWCLAYHAGFSYEYLLGPIGLGLEVGYSSSSTNPEANLKGAYAAGLLTFRTGTAEKKLASEKPSVPMPEPEPAAEPASAPDNAPDNAPDSAPDSEPSDLEQNP